MVIGKDMGGVVDVGTFALESVGATHTLKVKDLFLAGKIFTAWQELGESLAGGLVEELVGANDFTSEFRIFSDGKGGIHNYFVHYTADGGKRLGGGVRRIYQVGFTGGRGSGQTARRSDSSCRTG